MSHDDLVDPRGKKLTTNNVTIIQVEAGIAAPPPQLVQALGQITQSHVLCIPSSYQVRRGALADDELRDLHDFIHHHFGLGEA